MAKLEILYKVRPEDNTHLDGSIIGWEWEGVLFTPQEMTDWQGGTLPNLKLDSLPPERRKELILVVRQKFALTAVGLTPEEVAVIRFPGRSDAVELSVNAIARAQICVDSYKTHGLDSNWGTAGPRSALQVHGVASVDLDPRELADMFQRPANLNQNPLEIPSRTRYRNIVIPYNDLLSYDSVDALVDKAVLVTPARKQIPWPRGYLKEIDPFLSDYNLSPESEE